jgi:DNA-binding transcriptional MerR regulator
MIVNKSKSAFKTIAEVADELGVATHVLRFWETKFNQIKPMKATGGRRYYRPDDVEVLKLIKSLLYGKRYTIEGAQHLIKEKGLKNLLGEDEIQRDFFGTDNKIAEVAPVAVVGQTSQEALQDIAEAVSKLKSLRLKLAEL